MFLTNKAPAPVPEPIDPLTRARELFESCRHGGFAPHVIEKFMAAGREILQLPKPWSTTDAAIIRFLDGTYGSRTIWSRGTRTWAERVEATPHDLEQIAKLEAIVAQRQAEYNDARGDYVELARASYSEKKRGPINYDDNPPFRSQILGSGDQSHAAAIGRAERKYILADEALMEAKGDVITYKLRVQERHFASPRAFERLLNSDGSPLQ